tara:strand:- start:185 stop:499 length:315 start_codon:yes stop_codon:yes gene_type:complete
MTSLVDEHLIAGAYDQYKPNQWERDWVDETYKNLGTPKEPPGTDPAEIMEQLELFQKAAFTRDEANSLEKIFPDALNNMNKFRKKYYNLPPIKIIEPGVQLPKV